MTKDEFYYEYAVREERRQNALNSDYQERSYRIITIAIGLLGASAVTLNLGEGVDLLSARFIGVLVGLGVAFIGAVVLSIKVLRPEDWYEGIRPEDMLKYYPKYEAEGLRTWAGGQILKAVKKNDDQLESRARLLGFALAAAALEAIFVIALGGLVASVSFSTS